MIQVKHNDSFSKKKRLFRRYLGSGYLLYIASLLIVAYCFLFLLREILYSPIAKIDKFTLSADNLIFTKWSELQDLLPLEQSFMQQNVAEVRRVLIQIPWLQQVEVRKRWPSQLEIKIKEYQAVAYWNRVELLSIEGFSFSLPTEKMLELIPLAELFGPDGTQHIVLKRYYQIKGMIDLLNKSVRNQYVAVSEVSLGQNLDWSFKLNRDISVLLGRDATTQRLQTFMELYPLLLEKHGNALDSIDIRYESGVAVRLKKK